MSPPPSSYTSISISTALRSYGFQGPQQNPVGEGRLYWRMIDTPNVCLSNDKLQFLVTVYEIHLTGHRTPMQTMAFSITGEYRPETWAKIEAYSVPWDQGMEQMDQFQAELLRAWNALYGGDAK